MRRPYPAPLACLAAFECVARHGSVSRAADELHLTQSAVSRQILQLEAALGVALFNRVRRRMILTEAGASYAADIRQILGDLAETSYRAMGISTSGQTLKLSSLPTFGTRWLIPRLPDFLAEHPDVTVNMSTHVEPFDFTTTAYDAAIHFGAPAWAGADCTFLTHEAMVVVASPAYLAARPGLQAGVFDDVVFLHQSTRPTAWADWLEACGLSTVNAFRGPRFAQFAMVAQAAAAGLGLGLAPRFLIEAELVAGQLCIPFGRALTTSGAYYVACPQAKSTTPVVGAFVRWIEAQAKASAEGAEGPP